MNNRPRKTIRLNYWKASPEMAAHITLYGSPAEIRIAANQKSFIGVREDGITLSGGTPSKINIQGLSDSMRYAGLIGDLPFPLSLVPVTLVNPMPSQVIIPPFMDMIPTVMRIGVAATGMIL